MRWLLFVVSFLFIYTLSAQEIHEFMDLQTHPGLLESHYRLLEKEGVDLEPIKRSSEKFLQMWEFFLEKKGRFN